MTPHHFVNKFKNKIETFKVFTSRILKSASFQSGGGFTLIEAIIAIFVITVGIVAVLQLFPVSLQQRKMAEMTTIASQLGQEKMEEIISKSYSDISSETTTGLTSPFQAYSRKVEVTYFDPNTNLATSSDTGIKKIEVIIYWKSPLGVTEKNFKIATLTSKR